MHAVLVTVEIEAGRVDDGGRVLGRSCVVFDSEENAREAARTAQEGPPPGAPVQLVSVDVGEVVAEA